MRRSMRNSMNLALIGAIGMLIAGGVRPALADPPPNPPPCAKFGPGLFCWRVTDIEGVPGDPDRFRVMFEFVNWSNQPAYYIRMDRNIGTGQPVLLTNAGVDADGRPFTGPPDPPAGNILHDNQWDVVVNTPDQIIWAFDQPTGPIAHATCPGTSNGVPVTFNGLLDPLMAPPTTPAECQAALTCMVPGSSITQVDMGGMLVDQLTLADPETADDGPNQLDGFWIELDDLQCNESISFNWWLLDINLQPIGMLFGGGAGVMGDQFAFGIINYARMCSPAPPPIFNLNTGYDPPNSDAPDNPSNWAENEVGGIDTYPINPIPLGKPGAGARFCIELGAAVTAPFANPNNNCFLFNGQYVASGTNLVRRSGGPGGCTDVTFDGVTDIQDVAAVIFDWGPVARPEAPAVPTPCGIATAESPALCDLNGDWEVGIEDLAIIVINWRRICPPVVIQPTDPVTPQ